MKKTLIILIASLMLAMGCASTPTETSPYQGVIDVLYLRDGGKVTGRIIDFTNGKLVVRGKGGSTEQVAIADIYRVDVGVR